MRLQLILLFLLWPTGLTVAQEKFAQTYPPPGKMISVGTRKLHLNCQGKGSPTIILVAGGSAFSIDWDLVQPDVSKLTRVCSYDRAGLAWSDSGFADETMEQTISDLEMLLKAAHEKGPYVLVGASLGGLFIRAYQRAYPKDVAGLVFTNSANRIGKILNGKGNLLWDFTEDEIRAGYPLPASVEKGPKPTKQGPPFDRLSPQLQAVRLWLDVQLWEKWEPAKAGPETDLSWRKEFLREFDETDGTTLPLGDLPVLVLASGPIATEAERRARAGAAARLDFLSSNTVHVTAVGSGHEIHLHQPYLLIKQLERMVNAVRKKVPLSKI
jgi:pimeloyl-ACP methyl ester carboxylesterase